MFVTLAFNHPLPEHLAEFTAFMGHIERGMKGTEGLLSLESFQDPTSGDLVAIGRWVSPEHARAGVPRLMAIGGRDPKWTARPDDLYQLFAVPQLPPEAA